jgi:uncharacterized Rmd1/YagE family protein
MQTLGADDKKEIRVRALLVGERIDLRAFESTQRLSALPLMVAAGERGAAVLLRYGAVVLFDLSPVEEASFLAQLKPLVSDAFSPPEIEELHIAIDAQGEEGSKDSIIVLREATVERLQIVSDILAKSVVLAHYEAGIAAVFDRIEPLAASLQRRGRRGYRGRELLRHIGSTLLIQHKMVGRVEVEEKPEMLWEHPELERLYLRLEDDYELRERHLALERKLDLISHTAETLLDLLHHHRNLRVEWYIVILIVVEVGLTLYEMLARAKGAG